MAHQLLIDCYTAHERHFSCFLVAIFFICDFFLVSELPVDDVKYQSENKTNKYADKNRLRGYRYFLRVFVSKVKLLWLMETSVISSYINNLIINIEYLYKFGVLAFERNAIPLSFKSFFRTATVILSGGPCFIRSI